MSRRRDSGRSPERRARLEKARKARAEKEAARKAHAREVQEVTKRALWRLDALEYLILLFALVLALAGGALVAWLLGSTLGLSFRLTWAAASLLLFIVPGGTVYLRELRREGRLKTPGSNSETKEHNG